MYSCDSDEFIGWFEATPTFIFEVFLIKFCFFFLIHEKQFLIETFFLYTLSNLANLDKRVHEHVCKI